MLLGLTTVEDQNVWGSTVMSSWQLGPSMLMLLGATDEDEESRL